ncbi:MAG: hypothetical protein JNM64_14465 [Chloroflexia bacterium]|nr:hypothetical protein [Chloroflexia bacterium]
MRFNFHFDGVDTISEPALPGFACRIARPRNLAMQIKTDNSISPVPPPSSLLERRPDYVLQPDQVDFPEMERLRRTLEKSADIRPEVVARARALIEQTDYPPLEIIQRIGTLLALRLEEAPASKMDPNS